MWLIVNNLKDYSYLCRLRIEYMHGINIKENYLLGLENSILDKLLLDRTTGENIIWATDDHAVLVIPILSSNTLLLSP